MDNATIIKQTFAQRLKGLREAAGLTQQELAEKLGYSRGSISYYEKCDRVPDIVFLDAVAMFFDVNVNFLLGYSENQSAKNEDIGLRFGLSDKAIEILDSMDLTLHQEFISAFIEHQYFPKLFKCMELYSDGFAHGTISLDVALDEHEFRHYQITRILMAILDDMQTNMVLFGSSIFKDVDESLLVQYCKDMLARSESKSNDIIAKYEAEIEENHKRRRANFDDWAYQQQLEEERKIRIAAQDYVKKITPEEGK